MDRHNELQNEQVDRFIAAFNRIEVFLRKSLGNPEYQRFNQMVRQYEQDHPGFKFGLTLTTFAAIRNTILHNKVEIGSYTCMPTPATVSLIELIALKFEQTPTIKELWGRTVETVQGDSNLSEVVRRMGQTDFSQFPVVCDGRFLGMITYNGIARWFCKNTRIVSQAMLDCTRIDDALSSEEVRGNYTFMAESCTADMAQSAFALSPALETILVTPSGEESVNFSRIVTIWDVVNSKWQL